MGLRNVKKATHSESPFRVSAFSADARGLFLLLVALFQHCHLVNMQRAVIHLAGNTYMMPFMAFQRILVIDVDDALVLFGDKDQLGAGFSALFGAVGVVNVLGAAFLITYPAAHLRGFGGLVFGQGSSCHK